MMASAIIAVIVLCMCCIQSFKDSCLNRQELLSNDGVSDFNVVCEIFL